MCPNVPHMAQHLADKRSDKRVCRALLLVCLLGSAAVCRGADATTLPGEWVYTGNLKVAREYHTATLLPDGNVLVAGGVDSSDIPLNSAELYNATTGVWSLTSSLNTARQLHTATLLSNGNVLVAGGDLGIPILNSSELYNPWAWTGSLNTARNYHTATLLPDGNVLVVGGLNSAGSAINSAELYNPITGLWTLTGSLTTARYLHTATLLPDENVLVAGGSIGSGGRLNSAELYNPTTGAWTLTGSLNTANFDQTATLLSNGNVLVAGGYINSAELYNPTTGVWTLTGSLNTARYYHTATLLTNGEVLVAAGLSSASITINSAELYNPIIGVWTSTGSLNTGRELHTATLLPNGNVLVAGGYNAHPLNSAELYIGLTPPPATSTASATESSTASATASSTASPTASPSPSPTKTPLQVATAWTTVGTASMSGQVAITHDVSNTKDCMIVPSAGPVMTGFTIVTSSASICCPHAGLFEQQTGGRRVNLGQCTNMPCGSGTSVGSWNFASRSTLTTSLQTGDGCILIDSACYDVSQNVNISLFQGTKFTGIATYASVAKRTAPASSATPLRDVFVYTAARGYEPAFLVSTATAEYGCVARGTVTGGTGCDIPWGCATTTVSDYIYDASGSDCYALCYAPSVNEIHPFN